MPSICLIYATFPDTESARALAQSLLAEKLVACCNILPAGESHYVWEGAMQVTSEVVMIVKTTTSAASQAIAHIKAQHPYDNPAILQIPVSDGAPEFMAWVAGQMGGGIN
jgi:periplasmic divalent cation tolerance protein